MNWQIGMRAIMVNCRLVENEGQECRITGPITTGRDPSGAYQGWSIHCATGNWIVEPQNLRPIPDDNKHERFRKELISCDSDYKWNKEPVTV